MIAAITVVVVVVVVVIMPIKIKSFDWRNAF